MRELDMRRWSARGTIAAFVLAVALTVAACGEKKEETPAAAVRTGTR